MAQSTQRTRRSETPPPYRPHVGATRQYWRDIILGVNDGLVSVFLLLAAVVGGGLDSSQVLLAGLGGAVAGAISMAAGEYLATQSQDEVFDREIELEMEHIRHYRDQEVEQMRGFLADLGFDGEDLDKVTDLFSKDDERLLNAMKILEFGIVDAERRSPYVAMAASGVLFLLGSVPAVLPFLFTPTPNVGLAWSAALTTVGLFAVGAATTGVTDGPVIRSGLRNLVIAGIGGVIAYFVGSVVEGVV